jgi:hypothetical protein
MPASCNIEGFLSAGGQFEDLREEPDETTGYSMLSCCNHRNPPPSIFISKRKEGNSDSVSRVLESITGGVVVR